MKTVCVLGGGSFGTALAELLARQGQHVRWWMRDAACVEAVARDRRNPDYLSEFELSERIQPTTELAGALAGVEWIVVAVPSPAVRSVLTAARPLLGEVPLVLACKGIEASTLMTMDEVVADVLGDAWHDRTLALSGPSFAREIMQRQPTAVVLACKDHALADRIAAMLCFDTFRAYSSTDVAGVELGGALKNVMAIAAGAVTGMQLGYNPLAAMITRGLAEITRLAVAKGAHPMTLAGLAGIGDLVLTCTGGLSRNRAVGQALGEGKTLQEAIASVREVAEGVVTAKSAYELAQKLEVDAPITSAVYKVLYEGVNIREAVAELIRRRPKRELEY